MSDMCGFVLLGPATLLGAVGIDYGYFRLLVPFGDLHSIMYGLVAG